MTQRTAFILAAALTAFVLVVIGGVAARVVSAPTVDPAVEALIQEREAAYQQLLAEANAQLQEANARLQQAYQQQRELAEQLARAQARQPAQQQPQALQPESQAPAAPTYAVTPNIAAVIAMAVSPSAIVIRTPELVLFQGTGAYEVLLNRGAVYIDANSGQVLYNSATAPPASPPPPTGQISRDQAIQSASAYVGNGVAVIKTELLTDPDILAYEVKFEDGSEVYVDVVTGQVVYANIAADGDDDRSDKP